MVSTRVGAQSYASGCHPSRVDNFPFHSTVHVVAPAEARNETYRSAVWYSWWKPRVSSQDMAPLGMKRCSKCRDDKDINDFHKDSKSPDDHFCWCKQCRAKHVCLFWRRATVPAMTCVVHRRSNGFVEDRAWLHFWWGGWGNCLVSCTIFEDWVCGSVVMVHSAVLKNAIQLVVRMSWSVADSSELNTANICHTLGELPPCIPR